jgi:RES domain-containing protein
LAKAQTHQRNGTHRLIPAKYAEEKSVLETLKLPTQVIADLTELDAATNERKLAEQGAIAGIGPAELLAGVPEAHLVNAAFCHPAPHGSRFNDATRGAWYAAFEIETALAEVTFHMRRFLIDARIQGQTPRDYIDLLADFSASFHALTAQEQKTCLRPEPIPQCYQASQALARALLFAGSNGIVYPSVRHPKGTCIVCFRPALVHHPRRGQHYRITIDPSKSGHKVTAMKS